MSNPRVRSEGRAGRERAGSAAPAQTHKFMELMPPNANFDFVGKRKFFLISALLLIAGGLGTAGWLTGSNIAIIAMCVATDVPAPTLDFALSKPKVYSSGRSSSRSCDPRISSGGLLPVDFAIRVESQPKAIVTDGF